MTGYDDEGDLMPYHGKPRHPATTKMPWWNPRYWGKRVWIGLAVVVAILIAIGVGVGVTVSKANAYPSYKQLAYSLQDTYSGEKFFDQFNYWTTFDPAQGWIHYANPGDAKAFNLTYATKDSAVLRVDDVSGPGSERDASTGRLSVRVESKKTYDKGLFIFDVKHTPYGCATWPALWLVDSANWPQHGEIDVLESINEGDDGNMMTLHTSSDCTMSGKRKMTGKALQDSCDSKVNHNAGCGVEGGKGSFGKAFNDKQGGVMAVEWRDDGIRMWQFARDGIPADISGKKPTPDAWGTAAADFPNTHCSIGSKFSNNSIVANIDLCGELVEASWKKSGCGGGKTCKQFVSDNPKEFSNAFWEFGAFEVYQAS
ncbi:hypothetical protein NLG97_g9660 [Lecanicillium saksenae]|uniref:Uncharacterized protein n=1 Tax=Lecanicillium saksenae TaxID=468837 RepID=A0ACC1QIM9_9HYPO|nr:hypothetical protein NLG97_g9660 [Lecanicillium saksenae]